MGFLLALQQINGVIWGASTLQPQECDLRSLIPAALCWALLSCIGLACLPLSLFLDIFAISLAPLKPSPVYCSDWAPRVSGWIPSSWHPWLWCPAGLSANPLNRGVNLRNHPPPWVSVSQPTPQAHCEAWDVVGEAVRMLLGNVQICNKYLLLWLFSNFNNK